MGSKTDDRGSGAIRLPGFGACSSLTASVKEVLYQPEANGVEEAEVVDFTMPNQARWQDTLKKITEFQEVFDDYSSS